MISVYICEDDPKQLDHLQQIIDAVIVDQQLNMEIVFASQDPYELIARTQTNTGEMGIYVLDIALHSDMNGIQLAEKIKGSSDKSKIIFITTHTELALTVFEYQVEAFDFILKGFPDDLYGRFSRVLQMAQCRFKLENQNYESRVRIKIGETVRSIDVKNILYFESSSNPHKIIVHLDDGDFEYYGLLKDISGLDHCFYRCYRSYVVNLRRIRSLDKHSRLLTMDNGDQVWCSLQASQYLSRKLSNY